MCFCAFFANNFELNTVDPFRHIPLSIIHIKKLLQLKETSAAGASFIYRIIRYSVFSSVLSDSVLTVSAPASSVEVSSVLST